MPHMVSGWEGPRHQPIWPLRLPCAGEREPRRGMPASAARARARGRMKRRSAVSTSSLDLRRAAAGRRWPRCRGGGRRAAASSAASDSTDCSAGGGDVARRTASHPAPAPSGTPRPASSTRSHSTQRSTSGPHAQRVGEAELVPARHAAGRHAVVQQLVCAPQQRVDRVGEGALLDGAFGKLGRGTRPWPPTRAARAAFSHAWPTLADVMTSNVRARASTSCSSANGSTAPPSRLRGLRTPLAIALSLPSCGVSRVRTRSASPSSKRDRTIASVW